MAFDRYRRVLALPGVRTLLLVGMIARIPLTGTGMTLTLHVVNDQKLGFLQAGLVGTASMAGAAIGSPLVGRFVDRRGLRPVLAVTTIVQLCLWCAAPAMPYAVLLPAALIGGLFSQPCSGPSGSAWPRWCRWRTIRPASPSTRWAWSCRTWSARLSPSRA